jgi:hypothetical protein
MNENKKKAYYFLLYHFLLTIRTAPASNQADRWTDEQCKEYINYAGPAAYLLHNLALTGADNFNNFDEQAFWGSMESFSRRCPEVDVSHFRRVFDSQLLMLDQG